MTEKTKVKAEGMTDIELLLAMNEDDIDCSDIEAFTKEWLDTVGGFIETPEKELISIRIDRPVLEFYRQGGKGYQSRMNAVLRAFAETSKRQELRKEKQVS